ncbi:MAG: ROK family transcriptional regulator [Lawsonibacter sp.]|jgi:predicted NBD/HSP70 family sugar kinase
MESLSFRQKAQRLWGNKILNITRERGTVSKSDLCQQLGISTTALNGVLNQLIQKQYVKDAGIGPSSGGRKPSLISLNGNGAYLLGLEFSIEGLSCAILNLEMKICYQNFRAFHLTETAEELITAILEETSSALEQTQVPEKMILGACIGVPGHVDYDTGTLVLYTSHPMWNNLELVKRLQPHFPWPLFLKNNVDVMPYAYKWVYRNGTCEDHAIMAIRYGFKISSCLNNQQVRGNHGFTGEIGHMRVAGSNRLCRCGKRGCFDTEVTYEAICHKIQEGLHVGLFPHLATAIEQNGGQLTIDLFIQACNDGDEDALRLMQETADTLCSAISWVYYTIDPAVLLINSRLGQYRGFYNLLSKLLYEHHENSFTYGKMIVRPSPFGEYFGAIGAAAYVYEYNFGMTLE